MHIIFSDPRDENTTALPDNVSPAETITQFVLLGLVVAMCFYQPSFLVDLINQSIAVLPG
jgi:hypothetical protein